MKRFGLSVFLVVAMALLGACAHMTEGAPKKSASPAIDRILQKGELVVGTAASMPPLNMTTKDGDIIGFEIDLARYIAGGMGVKLKIEPMPFAELLPALETGRVDAILSGMTITPGRNLKVAFVGPYFLSGKSVLTKAETIASAKAAADINNPGVTLAALSGSTSQYFVEKLIPRAKLVTTKDYDEAVALVLRDEVDAMVADYPICLVSVARYPEAGLVSLKKPLTYEPLGVALPPNDPLLVNWVQNLLVRLQGSGELERLTKSWFQGGAWLKELP